jgi:UDP:flavonoid glycosyltransferase YjiC (YdhE family)
VVTLATTGDADVVVPGPGLTVLHDADHDEIMSRCDVVISHGGLGTALRALAHGVPMLLIPLGRDQHINAARVTYLGAGLTIPADSSPAQVTATLSTLVGDPSSRAAAQTVADRLADEAADERALVAIGRLAPTIRPEPKRGGRRRLGQQDP